MIYTSFKTDLELKGRGDPLRYKDDKGVWQTLFFASEVKRVIRLGTGMTLPVWTTPPVFDPVALDLYKKHKAKHYSVASLASHVEALEDPHEFSYSPAEDHHSIRRPGYSSSVNNLNEEDIIAVAKALLAAALDRQSPSATSDTASYQWRFVSRVYSLIADEFTALSIDQVGTDIIDGVYEPYPYKTAYYSYGNFALTNSDDIGTTRKAKLYGPLKFAPNLMGLDVIVSHNSNNTELSDGRFSAAVWDFNVFWYDAVTGAVRRTTIQMRYINNIADHGPGGVWEFEPVVSSSDYTQPIYSPEPWLNEWAVARGGSAEFSTYPWTDRVTRGDLGPFFDEDRLGYTPWPSVQTLVMAGFGEIAPDVFSVASHNTRGILDFSSIGEAYIAAAADGATEEIRTSLVTIGVALKKLGSATHFAGFPGDGISSRGPLGATLLGEAVNDIDDIWDTVISDSALLDGNTDTTLGDLDEYNLVSFAKTPKLNTFLMKVPKIVGAPVESIVKWKYVAGVFVPWDIDLDAETTLAALQASYNAYDHVGIDLGTTGSDDRTASALSYLDWLNSINTNVVLLSYLTPRAGQKDRAVVGMEAVSVRFTPAWFVATDQIGLSRGAVNSCAEAKLLACVSQSGPLNRTAYSHATGLFGWKITAT